MTTTIQHLDGCESWLPLAAECHCPCPMELVDSPTVDETEIRWRCCGKGISVTRLGGAVMRLFPEQVRAWHLSLSQYPSPTR